MAIELNEGESIVEGKEGSGQKFDPEIKRVDFLDKRVYERSEGLYYPSVTSILSALPPSGFFLDWIKETGFNADIIRDRAAREGTQIHEGIEQLLSGKSIEWMDKYGNAKYNLQVWKMLLKFQDFYTLVKPETLLTETFTYSDKYRYAGTADYVCKVGKETWLLDWKSSNHCGLSYFLQLAAYANSLVEQQKVKKIDRAGVVWLKASTRTSKFLPKEGTVQGQGWQILFVDDIVKHFETFLHVYEIYKMLNPKIEPYNVSYPTEISLVKAE